MGRKIIYLLILSLTLFSAAGCADFDLHVKDEARGVKPEVILLGKFEIRNLNYDPYVAEEFREALQFEFFRKGYKSVLVKNSDSAPVNENERAAETCVVNKGDILITGVLSQRESGFLADRKTDTLISFTVFGKNGEVTGKGYYHINESAGDESVRRGAACRFAAELIETFEKVQ